MSEDRHLKVPELDQLRDALARAAEPKEPSPARRVRRAVFAVATTALAVAIALGIGLSRDGRSLSVEDAVAAVAHAALDAPGLNPGKTTYVRTRFRSMDFGYGIEVGTYQAVRSVDTESWYSGGKDGWLRWTIYPLVYPTGRDRAVRPKVTGINKLTARDSKKHVVICETGAAARISLPTDAAQRLGLTSSESLPNDSDELYAALLARAKRGYHGPGGAAQGVWQIVVDAMRGSGLKLNPGQQSALVGALGRIPGVRTLGRVDSPNGIPSIGFERRYYDDRMRSRVYFSESNALTTFYDETVMKFKPFDPYSRAGIGDYAGVRRGTVVLQYSLLDYKHVSGIPPLKPSTGGGLAAGYCRSLRRKHRSADRSTGASRTQRDDRAKRVARRLERTARELRNR